MIEIYETEVEHFVGKNGIIDLTTNQSLSRKQKSMLGLAARIAETSELSQKHGAVIVKSGRVISVGVNKWRNRALLEIIPDEQDQYYPTLSYHAEIDALSRAGTHVEGSIVYVARINNNGEHKFSRPCDNCLAELKTAGVRKIIYTAG